jgi:hypothetical protein
MKATNKNMAGTWQKFELLGFLGKKEIFSSLENIENLCGYVAVLI